MAAETKTQELVEGIRVCPVTGLKVQRDAENLIKINAVMAVVSLLI